MRTYDDTFSGQKIYPGKVRFPYDSARRMLNSPPKYAMRLQTTDTHCDPLDMDEDAMTDKIGSTGKAVCTR